MLSKVFRVALVTIATVSFVPSKVDAATVSKGEHCVQHVTGQKASGELIVSAQRCYTTFEGAMAAENVAFWGDNAGARAASARTKSGSTALLSFTLGIHYDLQSMNPAGGSTSTVGTSCSGGWLNTSPAWTNRISSTSNGCPSISHYDLNNLTGSVYIVTGAGGNLGAMNNRTNSIQYN